jgi:hypothetical protein
VGFEPTCPFGHGISNPTPYQARRPPPAPKAVATHIILIITSALFCDSRNAFVKFTDFKKIILYSWCIGTTSLNLKEANEVFRRAIIKAYFEPELLRMDYRKSSVKHPNISDAGLTIEDILHVYFDVYTGNDYPDGDEWFSVEYLLPYSVKLPDGLKGPDYFTTISVSEGKHYWRHRELVRFKYGKSKKLAESLQFIDKKYKELSKSIHDSPIVDQLK